jgi:hypothetical protein
MPPQDIRHSSCSLGLDEERTTDADHCIDSWKLHRCTHMEPSTLATRFPKSVDAERLKSNASFIESVVAIREISDETSNPRCSLLKKGLSKLKD